uniref:MBD domain-containing protein n=1 Tax=Glossina palpalis gambiensis TaxID=67801 RepID=A0A1B0BP09_9MUSC
MALKLWQYLKENIHEKYTYLLHADDMGIDNRTLNAPALQVGYYVIFKLITCKTIVLLLLPTGATLRSPFQIKDYLLSPGTCKCGLPCPLRPEYFFDFNVQQLIKRFKLLLPELYHNT